MTIRHNIPAREYSDSLYRIEACAEHAPDGEHEIAKQFVSVLGSISNEILARLKQIGLPIDNCDGIREIEAVICGAVLHEDWAAVVEAEEFGRRITDA